MSKLNKENVSENMGTLLRSLTTLHGLSNVAKHEGYADDAEDLDLAYQVVTDYIKIKTGIEIVTIDTTDYSTLS